ncbi:hypothetical protein K505DRAFT_86097 [Melanomma pulvis-pyrius CBS 109.77]|uniref:Uncharacterized protein n=1 Tax=Melanomma pulvis-pyrius CBS 109.77 TaxID=1314802 RepID=A0A6A6X1I1_9PLEO|nr:hypothetical protein K505DRAFT_86097 [Melanomma pulvis-pyrius CBS 109.77]
MRLFTSMAVMALVAAVTAVPITPSAHELQRLAERMRSEGMAEQDITKHLTLPASELDVEHEPRPLLSYMTTKLHALFHTQSDDKKRDASGDIAPGSLEAPQMLPRAAAPDSLSDKISQIVSAILRRGDAERRKFAYEGKELEMRRPEGMRHWNS